jgi:protein-disulfide isomerase
VKKVKHLVGNLLLVSIPGLAIIGSLGIAGSADSLYSYNGKTYGPSDLEPPVRQALFDAEKEYFDNVSQIADEAVLMTYVKDEAVKKKVSEEEFRSKLFTAKAPGEKEIKEWYEKNKDKVPYPFDKIKDKIGPMLQGEAQGKQRAALIEELKKKNGFKLMAAAPVAPNFQIGTKGYPAKGHQDAKVTLVEFADFQCPHCKHANEVLEKVMKKYGDRVKLVYIDYPINPSGISRKIAEGAVCAAEQNKYWEYHDLAFSKQPNFTETSATDLANELKLDSGKFTKCLATPEPKAKVAKGEEEGRRVGVQGTPSFFINGRKMQANDEEQFSKEIESALKG